jgi:hypothetical protein
MSRQVGARLGGFGVYNVMLFLHIVGVVVLSSAVAIEVVNVLRMMAAPDVRSLRSALATAKIAAMLAPISAIFLLIFGLGMAGRGGDHPAGTPKVFSFTSGWLITAYVSFAIMLALGGGVNGRRLALLQAAANAAPDGPVTAELDTMRHDPVLAFAVVLGPCAILLFLFLMTNKPPGANAAIAAVVAAALGGLASRLLLRRAVPSTARELSADQAG